MTTHLSVFAKYRAYLFSLAQRILGSAMDAEDLLQETFIRWQQTSLSKIESPKAFLSTVLKRLCLNHVHSARVRREECLGPNFPEPTTESAPHDVASDGVAPALLVLLQRLSPSEQVVLLLREVFDCEYEEIASFLRKRAITCRQMLSRARQHLTEGRVRFTTSPERLQRLERQFTCACTTGDPRALISLLA